MSDPILTREQWDERDATIKRLLGCGKYFSVPNDQMDALRAFLNAHEHPDWPPAAMGRCFAYKFVPTSCGTSIVVECSCGESVDLSDYDSW